MALNLDSWPDYTDAQILKHLRRCLVDATFAQNWSVGGQSVGRMTADKIQALIEKYEARVASAAVTDGGGQDALVVFGETQ